MMILYDESGSIHYILKEVSQKLEIGNQKLMLKYEVDHQYILSASREIDQEV